MNQNEKINIGTLSGNDSVLEDDNTGSIKESVNRNSISDADSPLRVYTWPRETYGRELYGSRHPYLYGIHSALMEFGFEFPGGIVLDDHWLESNSANIDVLLVHWGIEHFWRGRGNGFVNQCRALIGIWQYFRHVKKHKIQFVWVVHDLQHHEGPGLVDRIGYRILASAADICVLHSQSARNSFVARYPLARNKCLVLDMGNYDSVYLKTLNRDTTRKQLVTKSGRRILIACGMIRPYKGLETAVAAMQHLSAEYHLVIAGPPLIPSYVEELRAQIGDRDSVTFLPRPLDEQEFADLHDVADCVLLPYHKITGSAALLAACTLSRGVVATDLPYFRDLLALEPDAGVLVPPGDAVKLAEGIRQYFTKPVEVRHAASRRIADRYPWESVLLPLVEKLRLNARMNHANTSTL